MSSEVTVLDYGSGNVFSVCRALEKCGAIVKLTAAPVDVPKAERLVLPGVGAFADCMDALRERRLIEPVLEFVRSERPFLGICVGMQILFDFGEEFQGAPGLGLLPGRVTLIPNTRADGSLRKVPHIGWSPVVPPTGPDNIDWEGSILERIPSNSAFYFVHSFTACPSFKEDCLAVAEYDGAVITAAVKRHNVTGVQFHPEKSGPKGLAILTNFIGNFV